MKIEKIRAGAYRVTDKQGVFIIKGGQGTLNGHWQAWEAENIEDCNNSNSWGVVFKTKKALLEYAARG